jgi:hypothetical protein
LEFEPERIFASKNTLEEYPGVYQQRSNSKVNQNMKNASSNDNQFVFIRRFNREKISLPELSSSKIGHSRSVQ